jgi:YidC/Oxa1 family membrane protein insertase
MIKHAFDVAIFTPLYNGLIFFIEHVPFADVGVAVVLLTLLVKFILLPLAHKAIRAQALMRTLEADIARIKETYKDNREAQARKTMELYKEKGINPFSGFLLILIQLPIIFGLYWVFFKGGLPMVNVDILYSFIQPPQTVNMEFLGLIDMSGKSILLALLAGLTQFFHARISLPDLQTRSEKSSFKDDLARSFHIQMRYVLPVIVAVIAYTISSAIALYWVTSNVFAIGQEIFVRKRILTESTPQKI